MKKALSALLAAVMVLGLLALAPITAHAATIEVANATEFGNAITNAANGDTIRLIANITCTSTIEPPTAKTVTLDLNGNTLEAAAGIKLDGGAKRLLLADPTNGEFNVTGQMVYGNGINVYDGCKAEISNVTLASGTCVWVQYGEAVVYGNITNTGTASGVYVFNRGKVTVEGTIPDPTGGAYIHFGDTTKTAAQYTTPSTKAGYKTYTDGSSTVWVKCAAHTFGEWVVDTQPTATTTGTKHRSCTACNFREDGTIDATGGSGDDTGDYFKLWGKTTTYLKSNFWNWILLIFLFGWIWMAF